MVTIGDSDLPGLILTIESAASAGSSRGSPGVPVILGQGYLAEGTASHGEVQRITRPSQARNLFGPAEKSRLTLTVHDALGEDASPVYAIAAEEISVTNEDLSGKTGQVETLANSPVLEVEDDITMTVNSTSKTVTLIYDGDPEDATPGTDEVLMNPVTGKYHVDEALGNVGDQVSYTHVDYGSAFTELLTGQVANGPFVRDVVDYVAVISEKDSVVDDLDSNMDTMESDGWLAIGVAGAGDPYIDNAYTSADEISTYSHSYDSSRVQLIYPSRNDDGDPIIGSYIGKKSVIGIDTTPIFKRLDTQTALIQNLDTQNKKDLVSANVVPIQEGDAGAKIIEDVTTVLDANVDEQNWKQASARLITDFVADIVSEEAEPFVGEFNNRGVSNSIRGNISSRVKDLLISRVVDAYDIVVQEVDATTLAIDVSINTADPLRNIEATVTAGAVTNGITIEG